MSPQSSIGHYRIVSKLGEGGMGAVYRATDTRLNREVAIKVLPAAVASDPDRLARFTRESQVLASLNHPNIAAVYGVEERAIVMELVEGQPPAGPISVETALPLISQLIDALEYAHEKSVVHRDLKPANLKITPEGRLKVLDFGLAKALSPDTSSIGDPASSPDSHHAGHHDGNDHGHCRLYVARTGTRPESGQARRHPELRRRVLRIAHGSEPVRLRNDIGHACGRA